MQSFESFAEYILENSNHNTDKSNKKVHIILYYPKIPWDDYSEYLTTLTWFTGIGWNNSGSKSCNVIFSRNLDDALNKCNEYNHAMISFIGTFYQSYQENSPETIADHFDRFCNSKQVCRGHLLFHPHRKYGRLHSQCMFMDLSHWRKIGRPMVWGDYTGKVKNFDRSISNVHDDYTPHWIKPAEGWIDVKDWHMGEYISKVLEDGKQILNFDKERNCKFFTYPERYYEKSIESDMLLYERNRPQNIVYVKNNEKLSKCDKIPQKKYDVIWSPASGEMSEYLWKKFGHENTELVIFDNHEVSLRWKKSLYNSAFSPKDIVRINKFISKNYDCFVDDVDYRKEVVKENLQLFSDDEWIETIHKIKNVKFLQQDVVNDILNIDSSKTNLVCFSNIFSYMFLLHQMKVDDIHNQFKKYLEIPNTTIIAKNVFRDSVYYENSCG